MAHGLLVCAWLTASGFILAQLPALASNGINPLIVTLLLGIFIGNTPLAHRFSNTAPGLTFATNRLLRVGIVLFGLSLTLQQITALGPMVLVLDGLVITTVLTSGYFIGTRVLGLDPETSLLTSAGSAICGAAAVLATESTIGSRSAATSMAVSTVVVFGSLAMLVYPLLYPLTGMHEGLFGVYIGATVHEVAQVIAAGEAVGPDALTNAVIVKLARVMMLVPFLLIVGQLWLRRQTSDDVETEGVETVIGQSVTIPWFAFGFLAVVTLNSFIDLPALLHQGLVLSGQLALTMAMAAVGFNTRLSTLRALGLRPFFLALILFIMLMVGGGLASSLLLS